MCEESAVFASGRCVSKEARCVCASEHLCVCLDTITVLRVFAYENTTI